MVIPPAGLYINLYNIYEEAKLGPRLELLPNSQLLHSVERVIHGEIGYIQDK